MKLTARMARVGVIALLAVPIVAFGVRLDRYPEFYIDEPFYNYPSISFLEGSGYHYRFSDDTPFGDSLWAYNGPFFLRLQTINFKLFGSSLATWRWPDFIAALAGIGLLCAHLLKHDRPLAAIALAAAWVGDRSLMETLLGRPDGVALLLLVVAFLLLMRGCKTHSAVDAFAAGASIGAACGFHFTAAPFALASYIVMGISIPPRRILRVAGAFTLGGTVMLLTVLWMWAPRVGDSIKQLLWHLRLPMPGSYSERFSILFQTLRWSRYWAIGLLVIWVVCCVIAGRDRVDDDDRLRLRAACLFGAAGVFSMFTPRLYPYYLIYFTCWPLVGLLPWMEGRIKARGWKRLQIVLVVVLAVAWLPSLAWNSLRAREAATYSNALDHRPMIELLRGAVPAQSNVEVDPELLSSALEANLKVTPLPWRARAFRPDGGSYVLLREAELIQPRMVDPSAFDHREVVFRGSMFPNAGPLDYRIVILGSRAASSISSPVR